MAGKGYHAGLAVLASLGQDSPYRPPVMPRVFGDRTLPRLALCNTPLSLHPSVLRNIRLIFLM